MLYLYDQKQSYDIAMGFDTAYAASKSINDKTQMMGKLQNAVYPDSFTPGERDSLRITIHRTSKEER